MEGVEGKQGNLIPGRTVQVGRVVGAGEGSSNMLEEKAKGEQKLCSRRDTSAMINIDK